ncbi:MAG TPA: transglutaminase family protein [Pirellulales bacterium]|nr:transglutaminase family protein [Pirellulales bacterium]
MNYKVSHTTVYHYGETVPICHNEVRLTPRHYGGQTCLSSRLLIKPQPTKIEKRLDYFGNHVSSFTIEEGHQKLSVASVSRVRVEEQAPPDPSAGISWEQLRDQLPGERSPEGLGAYQFTFDSEHAKTLPELAEYAAPSFTPRRSCVEAVLELTHRIHADFAFDPTATNVNTPVVEVLRLRRGVCQDFAHLQIGCLRSLGLAARYVSGYLLTTPPPGQPRLVGADVSHAWLSVYCGAQGWVDFDPTNDQIPSTRHITLAWGRDYADVCPIKGVFVGGGQHHMTVSVDVSPLQTDALRHA